MTNGHYNSILHQIQQVDNIYNYGVPNYPTVHCIIWSQNTLNYQLTLFFYCMPDPASWQNLQPFPTKISTVRRMIYFQNNLQLPTVIIGIIFLSHARSYKLTKFTTISYQTINPMMSSKRLTVQHSVTNIKYMTSSKSPSFQALYRIQNNDQLQ